MSIINTQSQSSIFFRTHTTGEEYAELSNPTSVQQIFHILFYFCIKWCGSRCTFFSELRLSQSDWFLPAIPLWFRHHHQSSRVTLLPPQAFSSQWHTVPQRGPQCQHLGCGCMVFHGYWILSLSLTIPGNCQFPVSLETSLTLTSRILPSFNFTLSEMTDFTCWRCFKTVRPFNVMSSLGWVVNLDAYSTSWTSSDSVLFSWLDYKKCGWIISHYELN